MLTAEVLLRRVYEYVMHNPCALLSLTGVYKEIGIFLRRKERLNGQPIKVFNGRSGGLLRRI